MRASDVSVDKSVWDLAEGFIEDEVLGGQPRESHTAELAEVIQEAIEWYISTDLKKCREQGHERCSR